MRISDWSSDVCSSDLSLNPGPKFGHPNADPTVYEHRTLKAAFRRLGSCISGKLAVQFRGKIGRASCRERVCQYVSISVVAVSLKKKSSVKQDRESKQEQIREAEYNYQTNSPSA